MASLFDESDEDSSNDDVGMNNSECCDDETTFTVATILPNRKEKSNRRDTITRIMPTITIHDSSDKYAIPTTVEKARMDHQHQYHHRQQLWATESLIDDSPTNSENEDDGLCRKSILKDSIFRAPSQDGRMDREIHNKSITMVRNIAPAYPVKATDEAGTDYSRNHASQPNRRHSSTMSMTTFQPIVAKSDAPDILRTKSQDKNLPTARGANVKALVTTAFKIVADGLAPLVVESWDVDESHNLSGKKRSKGNDENKENNDNRIQNRRKSFNIRAEMTLLQDLVQEKTDECAKLRQVSYILCIETYITSR